MTTSPCHNLDAYLDGRLSAPEEEVFEAHLAHCETCVGTTDELTLALRSLSDVTCPPEVLDRALAEARRQAPDRAARPLASRRSALGWRRAVLPLLALIAAAVLWTTLPDDEPAAPQLATTETPLETTEPAPPESSTPDTAEGSPALSSPAPSPEADPVVAPRPAPDAPPSPAPQPVPDTALPEAPSPQFAHAAPADSVEVAKEELLYAFALVADAQDHAADAVADGVGRVSDAIRSTPLASPR